MATEPVETGYSGLRVDVTTDKPFEAAVKDLQAELGKASTATLMDHLASSATFEDFTAEVTALAGRSNLIEVAFLDWGGVVTLAGTPMRAKLFVIGNPLTASKLLAAGGPDVGLYLPTKILVHEDRQGTTHVSYDRFTPILEGRDNEALTKVAGVIDGVLAKLAAAAIA